MSKQIKESPQFTKPQLYIGAWAAIFGIISTLLFWQSETFSMVVPRPNDSLLQQVLGNWFALFSLIGWALFILTVIIRKIRKS